jgi:hypothetical protein
MIVNEQGETIFCSQGCGRKAEVFVYACPRMNTTLENVCRCCCAKVRHEMLTGNPATDSHTTVK